MVSSRLGLHEKKPTGLSSWPLLTMTFCYGNPTAAGHF